MTFEEFVPFNQFFVQDEAMTDVVSITFDIHDKTNNQIFMFDIFINSDNLNELGKNKQDVQKFKKNFSWCWHFWNFDNLRSAIWLAWTW